MRMSATGEVRSDAKDSTAAQAAGLAPGIACEYATVGASADRATGKKAWAG